MKGIPPKERERVKKEIGNYIIEKTLDDVGDQKSPVTGRTFKALSKKYKDFKKSKASPVPNLELTGKMLDSFKFKKTPSGIEIGIFSNKEAQKADNHNKFSSKSLRTKVPPRKFIPKNGRDTYSKDITNGIARILKEYQEEDSSAKDSSEKVSLGDIGKSLLALNQVKKKES